jgi:hypothetical protein
MNQQRAFRRADASRYKYQRINADRVRWLHIKPGEPSDEINVVLMIISDEELGRADYPYDALSYHWGEGEDDKPIVVHNDFEDGAIKSMADAVSLTSQYWAYAPNGSMSDRTFTRAWYNYAPSVTSYHYG